MIIFTVVDVVNTTNFIQNFINVSMQCMKIVHTNFFQKNFKKRIKLREK